MENKQVSSGGIGFTGLLTIVFIILKLCGVIAWSWWWVLAPIWISTGYILVLTIAIIILVIIKAILAEGGKEDK